MPLSTAARYLCRECGQSLPWEGVHRCGERPARPAPPYTMRAKALLALDAGASTTSDIADALGIGRRCALAILTELAVAGLAEQHKGISRGAEGRAPDRWKVAGR